MRVSIVEELWTASQGGLFSRAENGSSLPTATAVGSRIRKCIWWVLASLYPASGGSRTGQPAFLECS